MRPINNIYCRRIVLALILVLVAVQFICSNFGTCSVVQGSSMYPTFKPNDVVQAKTSYAESQRGDVVIITDDRGERVIKRILGLPGETVAIYRGFVYIDHQRLREPYLLRGTYTFNSNQKDERVVVWHLGDNQYFVLGDNRLESDDSRHYGPVERRQINRVVKLPENAVGPGFCEIMLSETGKVMPGKYSHHSPGRNRPRNNHQNPNAKILQAGSLGRI